MSAPIYTPFFIHPNQKKRITRKRNVTMHPEEGFAPAYDTRSRRHASSNEWSDSPQMSSSNQNANKRSRDQMEESRTQQSQKIGEPDNGPNDVAAEVEVNVEDDVGDTEPQPPPSAVLLNYRGAGGNAGPIEIRTTSEGLSAAAQHLPPSAQYAPGGAGSGESLAPAPGVHHRQPPAPHHHHRAGHVAAQPPGAAGKQFDPDTCTDIAELRHRLFAAYDRIEQLSRANMCINRLKHDNNMLKTELNKSTYRISQLESIVLERNLRLKQLLSENVLMSARMKRIQSEFGVDAVKEIFSRDKD